MDKQTTQAFFDYEQLKIQEKEIAVKIKELKPIITQNLAEGQKVVLSHGYLTLENRPTWKYTDAVAKAEEEVERLKADEVAKGIAQKIDVIFPKYKETK